jgi:hypothetical protein
MQKYVVLPQIAEHLISAKASAWLKREREVVQAGEPLVEVEADKGECRDRRACDGRPTTNSCGRRGDGSDWRGPRDHC